MSTQGTCNKLGSGAGNGSKTDPLADEEVVAVDVGVEAKELLQGQPGSLRHCEARLALFHPYAFLQISGVAAGARGRASARVIITAMRRNATTRAAPPRFAITSAVGHVKEARNNMGTNADRCVYGGDLDELCFCAASERVACIGFVGVPSYIAQRVQN